MPIRIDETTEVAIGQRDPQLGLILGAAAGLLCGLAYREVNKSASGGVVLGLGGVGAGFGSYLAPEHWQPVRLAR